MAREWMDSVDGEIETPFGAMHYALTQGDHVFLESGGTTYRLPGLTVNRVLYYANIHLYLQRDGTWAMKDRQSLYMTRREPAGGEASAAARDKAYEGVRAAWEAFIAENPGLRGEAEARHLNNEIGKLEEKLEEARGAMEQMEAARQDLLAREAELAP